MKSTIEIAKDDFIRKFAEPFVQGMKEKLPPDVAAQCTTTVYVKGKTGKAVDFKSVTIELDIPDIV